jgi:hypothetical protein
LRDVPDEEMAWQEAIAYCARLRVTGGGWRLPHPEELLALYRSGAVPGGGWDFWSDMPTVELRPAAEYVSFLAEAPRSAPVEDRHYVRCIRIVPWSR